VSDLTKEEQANVRAALRFLKARCGTWKNAGKALRVHGNNLTTIAGGRREAGAVLAVRIAKLASVGVDDVLTGKFPPAGTCPHCGQTARAS
jgi:hypothetical protein